MTNDDNPAREGGGDEEKAVFTGEENTGEMSTPRKDLAAAIFIAGFALLAMYLAWRLPVLDSIFTAPGLLPLLTGVSLLLMALGLGLKAVRQGAAEGFLRDPGAIARGYFGDQENRRMFMLAGIIFLWVIIVGQLSFEIRWPTAVYVFRFSSFETVSIPVLAWILRIFWRASLARCSLVSVLTIITLATIFRDVFKTLLPEAG